MIASLRALWHSLSLSKQFAIVAVMVLLPGIFVFLMAQKEFIQGLTRGATKG